MRRAGAGLLRVRHLFFRSSADPVPEFGIGVPPVVSNWKVVPNAFRSDTIFGDCLDPDSGVVVFIVLSTTAWSTPVAVAPFLL